MKISDAELKRIVLSAIDSESFRLLKALGSGFGFEPMVIGSHEYLDGSVEYMPYIEGHSDRRRVKISVEVVNDSL